LNLKIDEQNNNSGLYAEEYTSALVRAVRCKSAAEPAYKASRVFHFHPAAIRHENKYQLLKHPKISDKYNYS